MKIQESKPWFISNTQWGIILAAFMTIFSGFVGVNPDIVDFFTDPDTAQSFATIGVMFSLIYASWGRARAKGPNTIR